MTPKGVAKSLKQGASKRSTSEAGGRKRKASRSAETPHAVPAEFFAWLAGVTNRFAAAVLGVSQGHVRQLRCGLGSAASRRVLARWAHYQAEQNPTLGVWHIRKVLAPGVVWLAGVEYAAPALAGLVGRQVNVALLAGGGLRVLPLAELGWFDVWGAPADEAEGRP